MKVDRSKSKRSTTEVPPDCKALIEKLKGCKNSSELVQILQTIETWTYGKCELYHWIDVLDIFDSVLQKATEKRGNEWTLACDASDNELKLCVMHVLRFTTLLIEHSFSRHLYNSMEHLTTLLMSSDLNLVLEVLHLLYMFSKRSNFLTRLPADKRDGLLDRLAYLAESWGGKEAGFGLAACCQNLPQSAYPSSAVSIHLEFVRPGKENEFGRALKSLSEYMTVIHVEDVHAVGNSPAEIMEEIMKCHEIPKDQQMLLFTHIRLAYSFSNWKQRILCVQARLQALSVLVYANAIQDNTHQLLYTGLMEELVDVLELDMKELTDIKAAALRTLTSIIHLDRAQNFPNIIDVTGAGSYHGFLPMMVRSCISALTSTQTDSNAQYPLPLATALFSFLYHLASYELGGEALVNCGMLESLLKVVSWSTVDVEHITFVTRAVRVIDLITNMDMQAFQAHNGLTAFINRLETEVNSCRKEQPFEIIPEISSASKQGPSSGSSNSEVGELPSATNSDRVEVSNESTASTPMDTDVSTPSFANITSALANENIVDSTSANSGSATNFIPNGATCLPQRAALLKSMLNFLKKVIQDPAFSDSIRHIMESSLPNSLKHIISNAEYYGASLFLLASDVVTVYVFQEPSLLSTLQDSGLTDVVQEALLVKEVPATREVISSMPNVFSALCLNSRGLNAFVKCKPFQRLFKVLLSPEYLPAMRRRRNAEPMGDTASNLGNAMDELMRHQPSLRIEATTAIVKLLQDLCAMGRDSRYSCSKGQPKSILPNSNTTPRNGTSEGGSSDEDEDDDEDASTASHTQPTQVSAAIAREDSNPASSAFGAQCISISDDKTPVPLVDYILNVMKCVDAILSNNSTDDHCREFVNQEGLKPLMEILALPNLPIDFPNSPACQAVSSVCKSILNLAHEGKVLQEGMQHLEEILSQLEQLETTIEEPGSSVLLHELAHSRDPAEAANNPYDTPVLHSMTAAHAYIMMFIHVCRTGQSDIRAMSITQWGSPLGQRVLKKLSSLYLNLVWESTVLLALCSGEFQPGPNEFGRADLDQLSPENKIDPEVSVKGASDTMESDAEGATQSAVINDVGEMMEVDTEGGNASSAGTSVSISTQTNIKQDRTSSATLQNYAKLIKPILSASSRLGRALAELFGLLVKLCVGSPLRQRRGHHNMPPIPGFVSPNSSEVASLLADLLTSGLCWKPKAHSPVPRLTFSICAVGFSAPLLFDEKKFPYHLMLKKFTDSEGLQALFDIFYWAMGADPTTKALEKDQENAEVTDHQIEFLDSWLLLVEKFVNPKTVLESPHALPSTSTQNQNQKLWIQFDSNAFLGYVHKLSFEAIMFLWNRNSMKMYGARAAESMLAILCHILRHKDQGNKKKSTVEDITTATSRPNAVPQAAGNTRPVAQSSSTESVPPETVNQTDLVHTSDEVEPEATVNANNGDMDVRPNIPTVPTEPNGEGAQTPVDVGSETPAATSQVDQPEASSAAPPESGGPSNGIEAAVAARSLGLDYEQLQQLSDMGFPFELCIEALMSTNNLLQATDYLLNNGSAGGARARGANRLARPAESSNPSGSTVAPPLAMDWDDNDDEGMMRAAIAMSLGALSKDKVVNQAPDPKLNQDNASTIMEPLDQKEVDIFATNILNRCLPMLDQLPESVFRVCELLVAVGQRNGISWMDQTLSVLVSEILSGVEELKSLAASKQPNVLSEMRDSQISQKTALRIHLFSLIFDDFKTECSLILEKRSGLSSCVGLLTSLQSLIEADNPGPEVTPKWVAPLLLMIDLYEKTSIASHRRYILSQETDHCWKWFDINSGRWCTYSSVNNAAIDKAFWSGETSVKILAGRRRYVINFGGMVQLNEETSNRRPVSLWLRPGNKQESEKQVEPPKNIHSGVKNSSSLPTSMEETIEDSDEIASRFDPAAGSKTTILPLQGNDQSATVQPKVVSLLGLSQAQIEDVIKACVTFLGVPVESECLHAAMRLCLRLTRDYKVAVIFAQKGGVHKLLQLTQASGFSGFLPLSNLLLRHVIEDPACLKYAIEKMIRGKAIASGASTCKELHYLLRVLAPVACRSPEIFVEVAKNILRVDINCVTRRNDEDMRLIVKPVPCTSENFKTYMGETAQNVIQQLLIALTLAQPTDEENTAENVAKNSSDGKKATIKQTQTTAFSELDDQMEMDPKSSKDKEARSENPEQNKKKPLVPKYSICQLLTESVHSYSYSCKIIAEMQFQGGTSPYIPEDCSALAFLLDKLLPANQSVGEKDCSNIVRDLVSAMAGCNHLADSQAIVITEVKSAIQRAVNLRESPEKHARLQALAGLVCTMIESCPSTPPTHMVSVVKSSQLSMNQVVKLLIKKNLVVDLARIPHHLDLSSSQMAATVNAALKPLEMISRIVNQPSLPQLVRPRQKAESNAVHSESLNNTHTAGTSNSEGTHAQGEDAAEDADNTEHDISGAAESLDPASESNVHDQEQVEEVDDVPDVLGDIMDQLLDRESETLANVVQELENNRMDTDQEQSQRDVYRPEFEDDHDQNDTSDSDSDRSDENDDDGEGGEEEEDEDEDEEDEEDGGSNFDDRDPEFLEEGFIRFPGMDREHDDMLMVQYGGEPENTYSPVFFTNNATYNLNIGLFDDPLVNEHTSGLRSMHPLLTPPVTDPPIAGGIATRLHRTGRQRRYQYIQFNPRHPHPPAILQRLLGPSTAQEVIQLTTGQALTQGLRDARLLVMDSTGDQAIHRNGPNGTTVGGAVSNYTALHWWCEEAKALDGESMHDCVVAIKREIVQAVEEDRDNVFKARQEKKQKGTGDLESLGESTSVTPALGDARPGARPRGPGSESSDTENRTEEFLRELSASTAPIVEPVADIPTETDSVNDEPVGEDAVSARITSADPSMERMQQDAEDEAILEVIAVNEVESPETMDTRSHTAPEADVGTNAEAVDIDETQHLPESNSTESDPKDGTAEVSTEPESNANISGEVQLSSVAAAGAEPMPGPSGTQSGEDFRSILGDIDIPEGVDPSFLAALPEEIRQEVINEHLRTVRQTSDRAQPAAAAAAPETTQPSFVDVSPEFLAALPLNIQEEVLAQQRMEQQRRVASAANPNDPVNTEEFFRNLAPNLRQQILADMEESQIAVLPPDLAAEAQNLRQQWERNNRQILQDHPFFMHAHPSGATLSSILRNSGVRLTPRYVAGTQRSHGQWGTNWPRITPAVGAHSALLSGKVKGKQLVDHETLACLLVLLFVDEPRLNTGRLHRVLRNLCYHSSTRQWVIKSLLSVMDRSNESTTSPAMYSLPESAETPESGKPTSRNDYQMKKLQAQTPSWLNITLDAALGCRANVFQIQKSLATSKKAGSEIRSITIHTQAVPSICRHTLDVLSNLAKSFPSQFLPQKGKPGLLTSDSGTKQNEREEGKPRGTLIAKNKTLEISSEFWDLLLKLDSASSSRKCKSLAKSHSGNMLQDSQSVFTAFEASPFGQLITMLAYPFVRRSSMLTDKLLRLLSLISLGIPDTSGYGRKILLHETDVGKDGYMTIAESHLKLIVDVITSKSCSEEGLEEATSLLLNLSYGPPAARDKILSLLVSGVRELGNVVCAHIAALMNELKQMNSALTETKEAPDESGASQSAETETGDKLFKGTLVNRFTRETVVVTSSSKSKATCELQLPSMAALTSKTSSQAFFLRLLKVIISLRDAIRGAIRKHNQKGSVQPSQNTQQGAHSQNAASGQQGTQTGNPSAATEIQAAVESMDVDSDNREQARDLNVTIKGASATDAEATNGTGKSEAPSEATRPVDEAALLPRLSSLLNLDTLWDTLSECLQELGHTPDHHAVLVLQPAVEAFFLVHASSTEREEKKSNLRESKEAQLAHLQQELPPVSPLSALDTRSKGDAEMSDSQGATETGASSVEVPPDTQKFLNFAETHRTVLNQILRQSTTHLADGPFSVLVDHTRVLDFDVKRRYFRTELERLDEGVRREDLAVHVGRTSVFEDSFRHLQRRSAEEWKNRFYIVFEGEEGQDAGGLLREWYVIISREIFNPMYALFTISPGDRVTYMINSLSHCNSNHLCYFKFVGRVIAKAIYDNKLLECYFTRSFYKHILGKPVKYTDMESEDYSFYQGLAFLIENSVNDLGYDLTFSTEVQEFGITEVRDLITNGRNIPVSDENKMDYIRLVCQMKMTGAIRKQLNAFLEGFYDIIPKRLISIFNEQELELLISGLPNIDIEDLKSNTEYHKYQPTSLQIQWFWRALRSFDQADRAKFLQFVTGTSKVPLQGFGALEGMNGTQKFQIHKDDRSTDRLPSAHTCFNQLDLPAYETYDKLRTYLLKAIHECSEGFGFA